MLKVLMGIVFASHLIAPVYAIDEEMILQQLETLGKRDLVFLLAYQLAQKQDNYEVWHNLSKQYNALDTQFAAYLQAWKKASQINTQETYEKFLELRPKSMFNLLAIHQIFELVKAKNSIEEYAKFIEKFGEKFPIAIEFIDAFNRIQELSFEKAKQLNTVEIFDEFIKTFPDAPQTKEAIELSFNLAKTKIEKELAEHPEQLEQIAKKLYGEARRIQDESGCQPKQYETKECKHELFLPALRNYKLLKLPLFDSSESAIKMRDREERIAFENELLAQQKRIEMSIHEMKDAVISALAEQSKLLGVIIEQNKDLKITIDNHYKAISKQLVQIQNINLALLKVDFRNSTWSFGKTPNEYSNQKVGYFPALSKDNNRIISMIEAVADFIPPPYGTIVKITVRILRAIPTIIGFYNKYRGA